MAHSAGTKFPSRIYENWSNEQDPPLCERYDFGVGKCTWPDRASVFESTLLVLFMIAVLAVFVAAIDYVSQGFVGLITTF